MIETCSRRSGALAAGFMSLAIASLICQSAIAGGSESEVSAAVVCSFEQGQSWSYEGGQFKSAAPAKLMFEIAGIDLEGQSARLVMDGKPSGTLRVIRALNANHFLEVANEGFLNLTTMYDFDPSTGAHPAVHSRHFGIVGQPVFGQYTGTCRPKSG